MVSFQYERLDSRRSESNGWTTAAVGARFEAGTLGGHYLEHLPFGSGIVEHPAGKEWLDLLARPDIERAVLLDYGCGNGVLRELLGAAGLLPAWTYIGTDVNSLSVESCRRRYPGTRFEVVVDGAPLPFSDHSVDIVIASGVLEFAEKPSEVLAELGRVTRGWVALSRPGLRPAGTPPAIYWQRVQHPWGIEEHCLHVFDRHTLEELVEHAGLIISWEERSIASGVWTAPDVSVPLEHFSVLLRKR